MAGDEMAQAMRLGLMAVAEQLAPLHEFVAGEVAYYERQGFTPEQARAMVSAEFMTLFGAKIPPIAPDSEEPPSD